MAARTGHCWDAGERTALVCAYMSGNSIHRIAAEHERTPLSIAYQLELLGYGTKEQHLKQGDNMKLTKKFWMLQNGNLSGHKDAYGHDTVAWPGKSVFTTRTEADEAAEAMVQADPKIQIFVMEAVSLTAPVKPAVKVTVLKK